MRVPVRGLEGVRGLAGAGRGWQGRAPRLTDPDICGRQEGVGWPASPTPPTLGPHRRLHLCVHFGDPAEALLLG